MFAHGKVLILFDLLPLLHDDSIKDMKHKVLLSVLYEEDLFGILIDELLDIVTIEKSDIKYPQDISNFYFGTFFYKNNLVNILNFKSIVESTYQSE